MMKPILSLFLLFCIPLMGLSYQLRGKVTGPDGQAIPYVSIYEQHTTYGTLTNMKGTYTLELDEGMHTLVFRHLGYKDERVEVNIKGNQVLDVQLSLADIQLETVEIEAGKEDPAYPIMREVIKNKRNFVKQFDTYTCETYLKATLEKDTLIRKVKNPIPDSVLAKKKDREQLELIESVSQTYFRSPNTYKSVVKAYRDFADKVSGGGTSVTISDQGTFIGDGYEDVTNPYLFYTDVSDADINFYKNLIVAKDIGDRPFISPLHNTLWNITYRYKLEEKFYENGRVIYKIAVTPKNEIGPFFKGIMYVVDELWALKSVNLEIVPNTLSFYKEFHLVHDYEKTKDSRWILTREEYYYRIEERKNQYYGNSLAMHKEYELDIDIPNRFFKNELRSMEQEALERDSAYWSSTRPVTLKERELNYIKVRDSIIAYHNSDEYLEKQDSLFNHLDWKSFLFNGVKFRDRLRGMTYFFDPLIAQVRPFGVGGYRHAISGNVRKNFDKGYDLRVRGTLNYGFRNQDLKGAIRVGYTYLPKKFARAYVRYGDEYVLVTFFENLSTILSRSNFINKKYYGFGHFMELVNGIYLDVGFEHATRTAIDSLELAEWSQDLFGADNVPRDFAAYMEFLMDIKLRFTPNQKYKSLPYRKVVVGSTWPTFQLQYKKSIPGVFGSELDFDFVELTARQDLQLRIFGEAHWRAYAGRFLRTEEFRFTDLKFIRGSDPFLFTAPLDFFQLLDRTFSTQNAYFQGLYLHEFNGSLINKIPLLRRTPLQINAGGGVLAIQDGSFLHSELFAGLQIPFRILKQRFKIGIYYVTAYGNYDGALNGQVKVGISTYNPSTNRWSY
ncbi:MAG: DUF5686 and carboxypeptidase regulatory-like domain-containing protein [Bacteroidota bacterium]